MKKEQKKCLKCRGTRHRTPKERGITLIVLVITIILLLVLAGVTIKIIIDNNFVDKTQTAVEKYNKQQARENLEIALLNYKIGQLTGEEEKTLQEYLEEADITVSNKEGEDYTVQIKGYEFKINEKTFEIEESTKTETPKPSEPEETKYTVTAKHYLEKANEEGYEYQGEEKDTKSSVSNGKDIILEEKATTIENAKYALGKLTEEGEPIPTTKITEDTTIHLYYNRDRYNLALNKNDNIETVTAKATQTGVATSDGKYKVGQNVTIEAVEKDITGYDVTWTNWTGTFESTDNPYTFEMPASAVSLTANADSTEKTYTITFDANGGSIEGETSKIVTYNGTYGDLPIPTTSPNGYGFLGWFTEKTGGTEITKDTKVEITGNKTLYAVWIPSVLKYTYDVEKGGKAKLSTDKTQLSFSGSGCEVQVLSGGYTVVASVSGGGYVYFTKNSGTKKNIINTYTGSITYNITEKGEMELAGVNTSITMTITSTGEKVTFESAN